MNSKEVYEYLENVKNDLHQINTTIDISKFQRSGFSVTAEKLENLSTTCAQLAGIFRYQADLALDKEKGTKWVSITEDEE